MKTAGLALQAGYKYQPYILTWFLVMLGARSLPALYAYQAGPMPFKAVMMSQAVAVIGLGFVLNPDWQSQPCRRCIPAWSFFLALAFILATVNFENNLLMGLSVKTATAVFTLSFFMHSATRAVMAQFIDNRHIPWIILCIVIMLATLPLWMAPWAESIAAAPPKLHALLWSSPLSYLAAMLDYDYLRNQWFYQHTPYGMLRYEYPDKISYSFGLIGMSLLLLGIKTNANLKNNTPENLKGESVNEIK